MTPKIDRFLTDACPASPCLVVDLDAVETLYANLAAALPDVDLYYAVKANPAAPVLKRLAGLGSSFDAASLAEIDAVLAAGGDVSRVSYGNTIKKERDVAAAHDRGVDLFAVDAEVEVEKIARAAPGARVFCRLLMPGEGADYPLSRKFGCDPDMAYDLMLKAQGLGLQAYGLSFHVGSQQREPERWDAAIATAAGVFKRLEAVGVTLGMLNIGGGFPALHIAGKVPGVRAYGDTIRQAVLTHFGNRPPRIIAEPGRGLIADAGVIESEVVLIAHKSADDDRPWVYLDIGRFGGLAETEAEAIRYPITAPRDGPEMPVILAGPTCDSADVLYDRAGYRLPSDLAIGDRVRIGAAGAYTASYASVNFNGFPPLAEHYL